MIHYDNASTLRRLLLALISRKMDDVRLLVTRDMSYQMIGRGPLAGKHKGRGEALAALTRMVELTGDTLSPQVHDILANDEHGVVMIRVHAKRGERELQYNMVHLFHFREGRVCDVVSIPVEQYAFDEFYS